MSSHLTVNTGLNGGVKNGEAPVSPGTPTSPSRGGILKGAPLAVNGKISTNPNGNSLSWHGKEHELEHHGARHVRHSIISIDSSIGETPEQIQNLPGWMRCQRRLSTLLHTHVVMIVVCTLAALDAVCVIGQLICDILIMKEKLTYYEDLDDKMTTVLMEFLPCLNNSLHPKWNLDAINDVLLGNDVHFQSDKLSPHNCTSVSSMFTIPVSASGHRSKRAIEPKVPGHEVDHGMLYTMTHIFHLGSLAILSALLLETFLKVFAMGKKLKHHKLEVFDAIVVTVSWCLDVGFWEGIWAHPGTEAATILIILLPWRVVRIVNSFVLVIQEKDHVELKIVKQRLRQSIKKNKESLEKTVSYKHEVKALAGLCRKMGASESDIAACSPTGKAARRGSLHSVLERAASLTLISTMSSMGSVPSLFDMGDIDSDEENDNSGHENLGRKASHNTTLDSTSDVFSLENEDGNGIDNRGFDRRSSSVSSKESEVILGVQPHMRTDAVRKDSSDSLPPSFLAAATRKGSITRL